MPTTRPCWNQGASRLDIEEPQTTPDGDTIWLRTSKVPLLDNDDQIIGVLGLYQDITASKRLLRNYARANVASATC